MSFTGSFSCGSYVYSVKLKYWIKHLFWGFWKTLMFNSYTDEILMILIWLSLRNQLDVRTYLKQIFGYKYLQVWSHLKIYVVEGELALNNQVLPCKSVSEWPFPAL